MDLEFLLGLPTVRRILLAYLPVSSQAWLSRSSQSCQRGVHIEGKRICIRDINEFRKIPQHMLDYVCRMFPSVRSLQSIRSTDTPSLYQAKFSKLNKLYIPVSENPRHSIESIRSNFECIQEISFMISYPEDGRNLRKLLRQLKKLNSSFPKIKALHLKVALKGIMSMEISTLDSFLEIIENVFLTSVDCLEKLTILWQNEVVTGEEIPEEIAVRFLNLLKSRNLRSAMVHPSRYLLERCCRAIDSESIRSLGLVGLFDYVPLKASPKFGRLTSLRLSFFPQGVDFSIFNRFPELTSLSIELSSDIVELNFRLPLLAELEILCKTTSVIRCSTNVPSLRKLGILALGSLNFDLNFNLLTSIQILRLNSTAIHSLSEVDSSRMGKDTFPELREVIIHVDEEQTIFENARLRGTIIIPSSDNSDLQLLFHHLKIDVKVITKLFLAIEKITVEYFPSGSIDSIVSKRSKSLQDYKHVSINVILDAYSFFNPYTRRKSIIDP